MLLVVWCVVIFNMSAAIKEDSAETSESILRAIFEFFSPEFRGLSGVAKEARLEVWHEFFRKCAHFTEFAVLEIIALQFFYGFISTRPRRITLSLLFSVCYSCTDEIHQMFVPGRGCRIFDVGVDFVGALAGLGFSFAVYGIFLLIKRRIQRKKQENEKTTE